MYAKEKRSKTKGNKKLYKVNKWRGKSKLHCLQLRTSMTSLNIIISVILFPGQKTVKKSYHILTKK